MQASGRLRALLLVLTTTCGGGSGSALSPPATRTVTPQGGGTVALSDGSARLEVPAESLPTDTAITVTPTNMAAPTGVTALGPLVRFEPAGLVFSKPVKVTFAVKAASSRSTVYWSNAQGGFDAIASEVVGNQVSAYVTHFSLGFAGEAKGDVGTGGASGGACFEGAACQPGVRCGDGSPSHCNECTCGDDGKLRCVPCDGQGGSGGGGGANACEEGAACQAGSGCGDGSPTHCRNCTCGGDGKLHCVPCDGQGGSGGSAGTSTCEAGAPCQAGQGCGDGSPTHCRNCTCGGDGKYVCTPC